MWDRWHSSARPEIRMPDESVSLPLSFLGRLPLLSTLRRDRLEACCDTFGSSVFGDYSGPDWYEIASYTTHLLLLQRARPSSSSACSTLTASTYARSLARTFYAHLVVLGAEDSCAKTSVCRRGNTIVLGRGLALCLNGVGAKSTRSGGSHGGWRRRCRVAN
jgi:hypothetical protein